MRLVFVTDLDGTLLDHDTYSYAAAAPALAALREAAIPLVLASSKTQAEIAPLHAELGLGDVPAIVENGAGTYWPGRAVTADGAYERIRDALSTMPEADGFRGFGDMSGEEVARVTGLSLDAATRAKERDFSEPGLWRGDAAGQARFLASLVDHGIAARQGGRFLTLSFGRTKADALADLRAGLNANFIVALGDAPNDAEMLASADIGIVVKNAHAPPMPLFAPEVVPRIRFTNAPGPIGWNRAVLEVLQEHGAKGQGDG